MLTRVTEKTIPHEQICTWVVSRGDVPDDGSLEFRAGSKIGHEMK